MVRRKEMNRRGFLSRITLAAGATLLELRAAADEITVYRVQGCSCCLKWVEHLRTAGFRVSVHEVSSTDEYRRRFGVPDSMKSCHTAYTGGYAIEGHVPAPEIQRLLKERPNARGLAVPGMPLGSPGMEADRSEAYSVVLFDADGRTSVYQQYPAR